MQDPEAAHRTFRAERDRLFKSHPASPLDSEQQERFSQLDYFPYDPAYRVLGELRPNADGQHYETELPEGIFRYRQIGTLIFEIANSAHALELYWIKGYGGGLFLPFKDGTSGAECYGGGRYLLDAIKGADLGTQDEKLILDFNFAYNPSCSYNIRWTCPLAMRENQLDMRIEAGEKERQP